MSLQFVDKVRFELNEIDSMFNSIGLNKVPTCSSSPQPQHHPSPTTNQVPNQATYSHSNSNSTSTNTSTSTSTTSNSNPSKLISSQESKKPKHTMMASYQPKIPSNLVKSSIPSFSTATASAATSSGIQDVMLYDRKQLLDFLAERQDNLLKTRSEYECQFENFFSLSKKFHSEKLTNLKLTFKNQILKQQIYFETEMLDLCKEYSRDYETTKTTSKSVSSIHSGGGGGKPKSRHQAKLDKEKNLVRQFKTDMKILLDYMRESLINSADTLIEAYETCQTLKSLDQIENQFQKQNNQMKSTTAVLIKGLQRVQRLSTDSNGSSNANTNQPHHQDEEDDDHDHDYDHDNDEESATSKLEKQLTDEQLQFNKYKQEMDELMHTLDDIELQHLQRKDQLSIKNKFCNKLKSKFKFIESKYDILNKQIASLKYESYVYKELYTEKKRSSLEKQQRQQQQQLHQLDADNSYCEFNSCSKSSAVSSSMSPSSLSKSSSTSSSLSDLVTSDQSTSSSAETETNANHAVDEPLLLLPPPESSSSASTTSSSSSSSLCNQDMSELMTGSTHLDDENSSSSSSSSSNSSGSEDSNEYDNRCYLSLADYNRKLSLINDLINLHKSKMSTKDLWSMSSSSNTINIIPDSSQATTAAAAATNFIKANIKCFNLKEEEKCFYHNHHHHHNNNDDSTKNIKTDLFDDKLANYTIFDCNNDSHHYISSNSNSNSNSRSSDCNSDISKKISNNNELASYTSNRLKQASSLDLTDCSTDGDRVIVENCNLKSDRDISNWLLTRQIENMSISKYQLPIGSVIKSGKVLKIETPFANDQLDFLIAIKNHHKMQEQQQQQQQTMRPNSKNLCIKIRTKLISSDGTLKAVHIQEIPQFYQDIFKYANMIQFL